MRIIQPDGTIIEGTLNSGKAHGLVRRVGFRISYTFYSLGIQLAYVEFDRMVRETKRHDPDGYLRDITTKQIKV